MARILLITPYFYPHKGGSQQYAEELYTHLMQLDPTIQVDVICYNTDNSKKEETYKGLHIYRLPCIEILPGQFAIPNYFSLIQLLQRLKKTNSYAFVNAHSRFFDSSWWTPLVAKYLNTYSMLTDHCAGHPTHSSILVKAIAYLVDTILAPVISRLYDYVTVISKATYDFTQTLHMKKPILIYAGVDTHFFRGEKKNTARNIPNALTKIKADDIVVTFVGRIIPSKGPDLLLRAAQELLKKHDNVYFIFAGTGPLYNTLKSQMTNHIQFVGPLEKQDVAHLLRSTDIFAYPSLHHEGLPIALLEAGASECAVVTTAQGGTTEIITDNKTGVLVQANTHDLKQALEQLILDPEKRIQLGKSLREKIEKDFDWDSIATVFRKRFESLLK